MEVSIMSDVLCIECEGVVEVADDVMLGELLECPDCGAELEVVNLNPLSLELAPEIEEDWGE
jgi:alpha-aminoadipate carrier protein LysW